MRLRFISSQTFKGLWSNRSMTVSVILVTFVSLLFIGSAALLQKQIGVVREQWLSELQVSVFMCPKDSNAPQCADGEASKEQIDTMTKEIESGDVAKYVDTYKIETKAEALANYLKQMEGTGFENNLTEEDMQVSFRIKLVDPLDYSVVTEALSGRAGVDAVEDQSEQVRPLVTILNKLTTVAVVLALVMVITALLLIPTTIRLSAMSRRNETEIMRYVGASNFFIELPFILEGVVAALVGSLLACGGLWVAVNYFVRDWLANTMVWIRKITASDVLFISPFLVLGAVFVAALASWLTLRRYARV